MSTTQQVLVKLIQVAEAAPQQKQILEQVAMAALES
jgi:hypothetical protein